ncbi:Ig-like domain-containing protein [Dokdonella sp.]|uniref:Ig-like domain-containing protein n=1 Tax=Dokdonella sp. TaxID=2291710 RepID=UPI0031C87D22|nr:Ig-like domain-containing protein [Dokdonella sp.]
MQARRFSTAAIAASILAVCGVSVAHAYDYTAPVPIRTVAGFDPSNGVVPFPNNLLLSGTRDLTLNIPVEDPTDYSDPKVAMNTQDGFSTVAPWSLTFSQPLNPATLKGGTSLRLFEVTLTGPGGGVTGVVRELASPQEFVVALAPSDTSGRTVAIVPTRPLRQLTSYMAVATNGIADVNGRPVRASLPYLLAERPNPLCANGASTIPALPASSACALEPLRQLVNSQEAAAAAAGVAKSSIIMSWVATTQGITPTLQVLQGVTAQSDPAPSVIAPTGMTLGDLGMGLPPVADIYIGMVALPYYLSAPTQTHPLAPLTGFWKAAPGAYMPPFDQAGLDPNSTNITFANPLPVATSTQKVPLLVTIPNAASGKTMPASGWPVVIFQHGITRNRTDAFAVAGTLAAQGFAVIAMDLPLHGVTDTTNPFYVGNTPLAALGVSERTFDLDLQDNASGAPGPDGKPDPSGAYFINLTSLLTSRDNLRESVADLMVLAHSIGAMKAGAARFDGARVSYTGQSLGGIVGGVFMAVDPSVQTALLNVPGGGIARMLEASPTFGPVIRAGLAQAGLEPGTPAYDAYFMATQTIIDSGDPINYAGNSALLASKRLLVQEVIGGGDNLPDQVIPNRVPGAPLSGTEPLIAALGLAPISQTTQNAEGIRGATRFLAGTHGSLLDPSASVAVTLEMQVEMASLLLSRGTAVQVANPAVLQQPPQVP